MRDTQSFQNKSNFYFVTYVLLGVCCPKYYLFRSAISVHKAPDKRVDRESSVLACFFQVENCLSIVHFFESLKGHAKQEASSSTP